MSIFCFVLRFFSYCAVSLDFQSVDALQLKQAYAASVGVILEGGKRNADPILMRFVVYVVFIFSDVFHVGVYCLIILRMVIGLTFLLNSTQL